MICNKIILFPAVMLLLATGITGCAKNDTLPAEAGNNLQTFTDYVSTESNTRIFAAAFLRSGMQQDNDWLSGGPYTYFVPVDSAFIAASMSLEVVNTLSKDSLLKILKYMVVKGRISGSNLAGFFRQSAAALSTDRPVLTKNYYGIYFNGITMQQANVNLGDAVVHKMNRVAFPPVLSTLEVISQAPELSIFRAVISRAYNSGGSGINPSRLNRLFATNGKTVFAPTNDAFIKYGIPSVDSALRIKDTVSLSALVKGHAYTNTYYDDPSFIIDNAPWSCTVSDFKGGFLLPAIGTILEDGLTVRTAYNKPDVKIVKTDILATDGVVQEIDQVILR